MSRLQPRTEDYDEAGTSRAECKAEADDYVAFPSWSPNCPECGHPLTLNVSLKDYGGGDVTEGDECPACHLIRFHDTGLVVSRQAQ